MIKGVMATLVLKKSAFSDEMIHTTHICQMKYKAKANRGLA